MIIAFVLMGKGGGGGGEPGDIDAGECNILGESKYYIIFLIVDRTEII